MTTEELYDSSEWIKNEGIQYLAVHFDLDVLDPKDFRSILLAEPDLEKFGAAVGKFKLDQVGRIFDDISKYSDIVGLTIAEHIPWDAIRLRNTLSKINIFNDR